MIDFDDFLMRALMVLEEIVTFLQIRKIQVPYLAYWILVLEMEELQRSPQKSIVYVKI